jgi:hypothetical protein
VSDGEILAVVDDLVRPGCALRVRAVRLPDGWLLDDLGHLTAECGDPPADAVDAARRTGIDVALHGSVLSHGPVPDDDLGPAVVRFAAVVAAVRLLGVAGSWCVESGSPAAVDASGRGAAGGAEWWPELADLDDGEDDWGSERYRELARRFQEESLSRWT